MFAWWTCPGTRLICWKTKTSYRRRNFIVRMIFIVSMKIFPRDCNRLPVCLWLRNDLGFQTTRSWVRKLQCLLESFIRITKNWAEIDKSLSKPRKRLTKIFFVSFEESKLCRFGPWSVWPEKNCQMSIKVA